MGDKLVLAGELVIDTSGYDFDAIWINDEVLTNEIRKGFQKVNQTDVFHEAYGKVRITIERLDDD